VKPNPLHRFPLPLIILGVIALLLVSGVLLRIHSRYADMRRNEAAVLPLINAAAVKYGLEPSLLRALVWKESRFYPLAVGSCGEIGLTQLMDGAVLDWARVNKRPVPPPHRLFDAEQNLEIGAWYLAQAGKHWEGYASRDVLMLAEYNAGRTKVLKDWKPEQQNEIVELKSITYPGTQSYIKEILQRKAGYDRESRNAEP
jgi:soluble lytic murein transglycosylase